MFIGGQPCTSQHMPPCWCCLHPAMLGHAGMQTPGSPLRVPVSISVNRGDPRALTQRGLELSLEHRGSVEISRAHPEGFGNGKGGVTEMPPVQCSPFPPAWPNTDSHLRSRAVSLLLLLPPQPPPSCYFKHANLSDHLSAPKFSEKIKVCELWGHSSLQPFAARSASSLFSMAACGSTC